MFDDFRKKWQYFYAFATKRLVQVNLQILYTCNCQCHICNFWTEPYSKIRCMSVPQIQIMANQLKQLGPKVISLCGGEPLMHKELLEIIRILGDNNFLIMVCNGWFVTPELAHALFKNPNVCQISVSLDYIDPVKHDQQRGKQGTFAHAVNTLKILNAHRCYPHQRVHMISVVMDDNVEDIEPLIHLADQIGVTYLVTLYSHGHGKKESKRFYPQLGQYLLKLKHRYHNFVSIPGYLTRFSEAATHPHGVLPCYAGKNLMNIDVQGNVALCIDRCEDSVGNIFTDDIQDLIPKLLEKHRQNNCGACWTSCRGMVEPLMYGHQRWLNLWHSYQLIKKIPLTTSYSAIHPN